MEYSSKKHKYDRQKQERHFIDQLLRIFKKDTELSVLCLEFPGWRSIDSTLIQRIENIVLLNINTLSELRLNFNNVLDFTKDTEEN